jgi:hypothetical protein
MLSLAVRPIRLAALAAAILLPAACGCSTLLTAAYLLQPADVPADAALVRLNNRLRNVVQAALGSLTLLSADPAQRLRAAESVFRSRDATALPTVEQALARETLPRVRSVLEEARAAIILSDAAAPEAARVAAALRIAEDPVGEQALE